MSDKTVIRYSVILAVSFFAFSGYGCKKEEPTPVTSAVKAVEKTVANPTANPAAQIPSPFEGYTFESGLEGWKQRQPSITVSKDDLIKHGGNGSLKVSGMTDTSVWNYAISRSFKLEPNKKYKLTGWLYVTKLSNPVYPPFLKVGIESNHQWISNAITGKYDVKTINQWQRVSGQFTTPNKPALNGYLAVEKGINNVSLETELYIDDLKLEAL
jgi:hypothetical protein